MFEGLSNIKDIDLSNFDFSSVSTMKSMLKDCTNIKSIQFGNIDTTSVNNMESLFQNCYSLTSIDLSKFQTSSVTTFAAMFSNLKAIKAIDASTFKGTNALNMYDMFGYCDNLISVNLANFDTPKVECMQGVFYSSNKIKYINLQHFDDTSTDNIAYFFSSNQLLYLNLRKYATSNIHNKNFSDSFDVHPDNIKYCVEDMNTINTILIDRTNDCSDLCFQDNIIFDIEKSKCFCNDNYKFEYNNICYQDCPPNTHRILTDRYICSTSVPENYYLDNSDNINKICHSNCKACNQYGTDEENNCLECIDNYKFINDNYSIESNCYNECQNYYYFSGTNQYHCVSNCPYNYNKRIEEKKKCIDDCGNDDEYIYEYNNRCYKDCPSTTKTYQEGKKCLDDCSEQQFEYNNNCCDDCPAGTYGLFDTRKKCVDEILDNYYYDNGENIYKICYYKCKTCGRSGTDSNNNCDSCDNNYKYKYNTNCFAQCPDNLKTYEDNKECLDECLPEQFEYNNICYDDCPTDTFKLFETRNICVTQVPVNYFLDNDGIYKKCYSHCKRCSQLGNDLIHKCEECNGNYIFINDPFAYTNNCYEICEHYYYFTGINQYECTQSNECPPEFNKLIINKRKCIDDCKNDNEYSYEYNNNCYQICPLYKKIYEDQKLCLDECYSYLFEYENICKIDCPDNTYRLFLNRNICVDTVPEDYFLDYNDNIYKKCFEKCKKCNQSGDEEINNCAECIDNFIFLNDSLAPQNNCYEKCDEFYYFDFNNIYSCVNPCPSGFEKLITQRKKCIDDCQNDGYYIFEYENHCHSRCPENLKIDAQTKHCLKSCYLDQFEFENVCYYEIPSGNNELFQNGNIYINNLEHFEEMLYEKILPAYPSELGNKMLIERPDNRVFEITNSINELDSLNNKSKNIWGLSIINLGQCEKLLKNSSNISENDSLIFIKNEIRTNKVSERNVKIDVYNPYTKEKLNLSLCENIPIDIFCPMELSMETKQLYDKMNNLGYNMFNINDPFYQDICTPFDSSNGTDILLTDRIDYIYYNEDTKCQSNCEYTEYSMDIKYISCSCSIDEEVNNEHKKSEKFNPKKLYQSFYEVLKYSNYDIIKCYNMILNIDVISVNLGSIIVIFYFLCYLICLFIFIFRGMIPIRIKLRNELYRDKKNYNLYMKFQINKLLSPPIKNKLNQKLKIRVNPNNKKIIFKKNIICLNINNNKNNFKKNIFINSSSRADVFNKNLNDINNTRLNKFSDKIPEKQPKKEYTDFELNELAYEKAIKLDKRSLCQLYCATLKREHLIFFTFFNWDDYNLLSVKIARFVFLMVGDMALNVFFFSDDSMHKLFLTYGKYDFIQQIPQITYSTILSQIIEIFLCYLSLTDIHIHQLKSNLIKGNIRNIKAIIKCIRTKLIVCFVFIFIFFAIYWYIISVFCGVYRNTQIAFIKDSLISFSIGLAYPFLFYFISASLRISSLRDSKKRCKCLYSFSYIIPFF